MHSTNREILSSVNFKINTIESFLYSLENEMKTLAHEQEVSQMQLDVGTRKIRL
jgi:hypothetical protein